MHRVHISQVVRSRNMGGVATTVLAAVLTTGSAQHSDKTSIYSPAPPELKLAAPRQSAPEKYHPLPVVRFASPTLAPASLNQITEQPVVRLLSRSASVARIRPELADHAKPSVLQGVDRKLVKSVAEGRFAVDERPYSIVEEAGRQKPIVDTSSAIAVVPNDDMPRELSRGANSSDISAGIRLVSDELPESPIAQSMPSVAPLSLAALGEEKSLGDAGPGLINDDLSVPIAQPLDPSETELNPGRFAQLRDSIAAREYLTPDHLRETGILAQSGPAPPGSAPLDPNLSKKSSLPATELISTSSSQHPALVSKQELRTAPLSSPTPTLHAAGAEDELAALPFQKLSPTRVDSAAESQLAVVNERSGSVVASRPLRALSGAALAVGVVPGGKGLAASIAPTPSRDSPAYISQISDSSRAAYIAQVDLADTPPRLALRSGAEILGEVEFRAVGGDLSVHIGQVLDLFESKMELANFARLRKSPAASEFVSLAQLRRAGLHIEYSAAYDELIAVSNRI